ncbi:MAG: alpha-amylase family glycosyl hydrolase, partial [Thermoleophilaceae bacterium]
LRGIAEELGYLQDLGVETLFISSFFQSPQQDLGYDITDHLGIAPEYGSREDVRRLFDAIHARGMKVVLDIVLNHTSAQHPWFLASRSLRQHPMRDFYIWRAGRRPRGAQPPNNWRSVLGSSGWHYDEATEQWYFASFLPFQPDLNYRHPEVRARMLDVVRGWLTAGADGLRLDLFHALHKDLSFADNPFSFRPVPSPDNPDGFFQRSRHTLNHPDTLAFACELRRVVDEFSDPPRVLVGEVFGDMPTLRRYCGEQHDGLHLVFLSKSLTARFSAGSFRDLIREFEAHFPKPLQPTWVFGNHDRPRLIERLGVDSEKAKLLVALQLTARGVPVSFFGDELGLPHHELPLEGALDPVAAHFRFVPHWLHASLRKRGILLNRDSCRSPMPWHAGRHAGFSSPNVARTWLPIHPASSQINVASQGRHPSSLLACYRRLLALRRGSNALSVGRLELGDLGRNSDDVLYYRRIHEHGGAREIVHVALNFSGREQAFELAIPLAELRSNLRDKALASAVRRMQPFEALIGFERGP